MPPLFWLRRLGSFLTLCLLAAAAWADALNTARMEAVTMFACSPTPSAFDKLT